MNSVFSFHQHQWEPYHLTEVVYFSKQDKHLRLFEVCMVCQQTRAVDLAPGEVPPILCLQRGES